MNTEKQQSDDEEIDSSHGAERSFDLLVTKPDEDATWSYKQVKTTRLFCPLRQFYWLQSRLTYNIAAACNAIHLCAY